MYDACDVSRNALDLFCVNRRAQATDQRACEAKMTAEPDGIRSTQGRKQSRETRSRFSSGNIVVWVMKVGMKNRIE